MSDIIGALSVLMLVFAGGVYVGDAVRQEQYDKELKLYKQEHISRDRCKEIYNAM